MDNSYRKIDIDLYDQDALKEEELYEHDPRSIEEMCSDAKSKTQQARSLLSRADVPAVLQLLLTDPPYGPPSPELQSAQSLILSTLLDTLSTTRTSDIPSILSSLNSDQLDWLMKYIYKAMSLITIDPNTPSAVLLNWHEKLTELSGTGSIVRVMTDRRRA
ncbi:actin-related protein 2/3 complex subunit 5 [Melampsora americana]|nr:actin-related protein 2/3 complex subunit 5 [Melampsora americana]